MYPCYALHKVGPILDSGGMGAIFGALFSEKRAFCLLVPPKRMPFLTISMKSIFFKTKGIVRTPLGVGGGEADPFFRMFI